MAETTMANAASAERGGSARSPLHTVEATRLEPTPPEAGAKVKKKKPKATGKKRFIKPVGILVLLLFVFHMESSKFIKPHYSAAHPAPNGAIIELATAGGTSSITTDLADGHLVQLSISLQMSSVGSSKTEAKEADALMGETIQHLGQQTYSQLLSPSGRTTLQALLLQSYQQQLGTVDGAQQVTKVYFTSFVLQ